MKSIGRTTVAALAIVAAVATAVATAAAGEGARVPLLDTAEAWERLPRAESGGGGPLPSWARALADSLPRTTAAMLDLDRLHRTKSPLGDSLRGKMRWVVADANRSEYGRAYAAADLRRAGATEAEIEAISGDLEALPGPERLALEFAREMTLRADEVKDDAVAELKTIYGEAKLTAMVLLIAQANFQDRFTLALGLDVEPGGPLPPVEVRFSKAAEPPTVPSRVSPEGDRPDVPTRVDDPSWTDFDFAGLQKELAGQRARPGRVRVPTWDEVVKGLPEGATVKGPLKIQWSLVCLGYQPELAMAWSACTRAFGEEAKQDRVFEESLFWVVTRQIHCFY